MEPGTCLDAVGRTQFFCLYRESHPGHSRAVSQKIGEAAIMNLHLLWLNLQNINANVEGNRCSGLSEDTEWKNRAHKSCGSIFKKLLETILV